MFIYSFAELGLDSDSLSKKPDKRLAFFPCSQSKDSDREGTMEQLHSVLSHSGRGNLLTTLCKFLGSKIVKELRDFIKQKHPQSSPLIPAA
jgi:hypothetical protein